MATNTATIATLSTKLDGAIAQITELKSQFIFFQANFVRDDLYNIKHEELVKQITVNSNEIDHLKKNRWVMPALTLVFGGVMTFLINYSITH